MKIFWALFIFIIIVMLNIFLIPRINYCYHANLSDRNGTSVTGNEQFPVCVDLFFQFISLLNPLTAGAVYISLLILLLAHYISAFKPVKDKKWH